MTRLPVRVEPRWVLFAYYNRTGSHTVLGEYKWWIAAYLRAWWEWGMGWHALKIERLPAAQARKARW